ncbi:PadR family transcriptional regulator, partial [Candidatus Saccharibacteria bacterium]|nr:PadR family transcriptional regulator [Candidatus Saccharibacteria bacterium]
MSVQHTLLGFLAEESNYGYELKKKYDGYFGKDKPILT